MSFRFLSQWLYSQFFVAPPYPTHDFTIIVTGSNTGLGLEAAQHFCSVKLREVHPRRLHSFQRRKGQRVESTHRASDCIEV